MPLPALEGAPVAVDSAQPASRLHAKKHGEVQERNDPNEDGSPKHGSAKQDGDSAARYAAWTVTGLLVPAFVYPFEGPVIPY